ncbi:MAG: T9SS type A sorting domain-containing protein [Dysgonamonadaceae bacterium]|jgi:ribosomal protein S8|nr:T9SS type A sorting domain-containing protein [Dysgonamonadaceae bacterium]
MIRNKLKTLGLTTILLVLSLFSVQADDALIVYINDLGPVNSKLDNVQRITFSDDQLSIKLFDSNATNYSIDNITKITFGDVDFTGISNLPKADNNLDVLIYSTSAGEIVVESSSSIQSLTLFSIDGKMLQAVKPHATSLHETINVSSFMSGVYLVQVKTQQGVIVKKVIIKK